MKVSIRSLGAYSGRSTKSPDLCLILRLLLLWMLNVSVRSTVVVLKIQVMMSTKAAAPAVCDKAAIKGQSRMTLLNPVINCQIANPASQCADERMLGFLRKTQLNQNKAINTK